MSIIVNVLVTTQLTSTKTATGGKLELPRNSDFMGEDKTPKTDIKNIWTFPYPGYCRFNVFALP